MFSESFPGGPLDERTLIYESLAGGEGDRRDDGDSGDDDPTAFACLGCGTVTTADDRPDSCPDCHRTPGDHGDGALFRSL